MRSKEELQELLRPVFQRIIDNLTSEIRDLQLKLEPGLERNSVITTLDIDLASAVTAGALLLGGGANADAIMSEIDRRTAALVEKYTAEQHTLDSTLPGVFRAPGNGTVN